MMEDEEAPSLETARQFLSSLFDFQFTESVTIRALPVVYGLVMFAIATVILAQIVLGFGRSFAFGLICLVVGPPLFVGCVTIVRVFLEFVIAIFRITAEVERIGGRTEELVDDLPRFHFWRKRRPPQS